MLNTRSSGILMHITSLPSPGPVGDLGPEAYKFADLLADARQAHWQLLPVNQAHKKGSFSPYNCLSAFAGFDLLISPEYLYKDGLLQKKDLQTLPEPTETADYRAAINIKRKLLDKAFENFSPENDLYKQFCRANSRWLDDYSLFWALWQTHSRKPWHLWPKEHKLKTLDKNEIAKLKPLADKQRFIQYMFHQQWGRLKTYCNSKGISLIGDMPIYVSYESCDVWSRPGYFKLYADRRPKHKAGVPPDLFSSTGQMWGNPVYDWDVIKKDRYKWWIARLEHNLGLFDMTRIDHFRGFAAYWQIPAKHKTAQKGKWVPGPGTDFFNKILRHIPASALICEDLGYITADVRELIAEYNFPCMKVLHFAFDGKTGTNKYTPHNHEKNCIVYTGTHDNNTTLGWFGELNKTQKNNIFKYLGRKLAAKDIHKELTRLAMSSVANMCIIPAQDILGLGPEARMNRPASLKNNWKWRMKKGALNKKHTNYLAELTQTYGRE